jgi:hypothetical protein
MAKRIYSSQKVLEQKSAQAQNQNSGFTKAEFVNLKPDPATGETVKMLRVIGSPLRFRQFTDKKRVPNGEKGATVKVPFPDAHLNNSYTRIGTENDPAYGDCPWTKLGYIGSWRYAVNVLERQKDGTSVVKILEKGGMVFNKLMEYETTNSETNIENPDDEPLCVMLGGAVAHDVRLKAKTNTSVFGDVEYVVSINPKPSVITDEEIELLKAAGMPSDEEIAKERAAYELDRQSYPQLPEWQDWYTYGYNIGNIFKPTPIKTETSGPVDSVEESTDSSELFVSEEEVAVTPPAKAAKTTKSAKSAPVELPNPFDEEESTDEEPDWD